MGRSADTSISVSPMVVRSISRSFENTRKGMATYISMLLKERAEASLIARALPRIYPGIKSAANKSTMPSIGKKVSISPLLSVFVSL